MQDVGDFLMTRDELIALARQKAAEHQLYPELVCALCEQESAWQPWAIRYEPAFYQKYVEPLWRASRAPGEQGTAGRRGSPLSPTEAHARAFSWGLLQVMGQTAREHGFDAPFLSALCDPATGLEIGCRVLARKLAAAEGNVARALLLWNGGANKEYPAQVLVRAKKYPR